MCYGLLSSPRFGSPACSRSRSLDPAVGLGVLSTYRDGWALSPDAARWARSTVWSRAFTVHRLLPPSSPSSTAAAAAASAADDTSVRLQPDVPTPAPPLSLPLRPCIPAPVVAPAPTPVVALVPVLDMTDHNPNAEVVWHTGPDGSEDFQFCPLTPVSKVCMWEGGMQGV